MKILVKFINIKTGKVNPITTRPTAGIEYFDGGFYTDCDRYKKASKDLPWDVILCFIEKGIEWRGSESFGTKLSISKWED